MNFCKNCGGKITDNDKFCATCGQTIDRTISYTTKLDYVSHKTKFISLSGRCVINGEIRSGMIKIGFNGGNLK